MNAGAAKIGQRRGILFAILLCLASSAGAETKILGHRGIAWNQANNPWPENTVLSTQAALDAGADGVEIDVLRSADGVIVLRHDDYLDRRAPNGPPKTDCVGRVSQVDWSYLRLCSAQPAAPQGFSVPLDRLEDLLKLEMRLLVLDVKDDYFRLAPQEAVETIAGLVKAAGAVERVVLMLYHPQTIALAHAHGLKVCLKQHHPQEGAGLSDEIAAHEAWGSCAYSRILDLGVMAYFQAREQGQVPYLLTPLGSRTFEREFKQLLRLKVDGVITDRIIGAAKVRAAYGP